MSENQDRGEQRSAYGQENVRSRPPITSTTHILPFEKLSPLDFERLCLWLVEREGYTQAEHLGLAGSEQGRDVIAYKTTPHGEELWYFQCKRYRSIRAKSLKDEVDKYLQLAQEKPHLKPFGVIFVVSCAVSADAREEVGAYCEQHNLASEFWALTELDLRVKRHPDLLKEFFGWYTRPIDIPFQVPPLPAHFVPRPEVSEDLKTRLLTDEAAPPGVLVVSAIYGLGGIGKSVLAAALAHDPEVQARFPDGVLWATLGQEPDVLSLLNGWIRALGDYNFPPTTVEMASPHLRTLLHDKSCLLVVDDAWQADHARAFLVGGERCRVLVTTRDATLARKVSAHLYDLDVMTEPQALALFEARLGPLDGIREQAVALAHELGYLPLALELAAAQVEAGLSWAELLDTFRKGLTNLAALDLDEATYRNESLRLSFRLSLERLSDEDREAFAWLGVLPEDAQLNPTMASTLWNQSERATRGRLRRFRDKALLKPIGDDQYIVHDLLHDEAQFRLAERMPLVEAHAVLLGHYGEKILEERWDELTDDSYIHEHLTWHMEQAGQLEAIHALLCLQTEQGHNAWYKAREVLGQIAGYLNDVRHAWHLAEQEFTIHSSQLAIGLQCRYALISSSLRSLSGNIPPALLVALVEKGVWTSAQGLAYARHAPGLVQQTQALAGVVPYLSGTLREKALREALAAAQKLPECESWRRRRSKMLAELTPHLAELGYPEEALTIVQSIHSEKHRAEALLKLAPHISQSLGQKGLQEVLTISCKIESEWSRAKLLAGLAAYLPESLLQETLVAAHLIQEKSHQVRALVGLAPHLSGSRKERTLEEVLVMVPKLPMPESPMRTEDSCDQARVLAELAPHLSHRLMEKALAVARKIPTASCLAKAIAGLALHLPGSLREEALQVREKALQKALAATRENRSVRPQIRALTTLALHLPDHLQEEVLQEALVAAQELAEVQVPGFLREPIYPRSEELAKLVPVLAEMGYIDHALAAARSIRIPRELRMRSLSQLIPYLSEPEQKHLMRETLAVAQEIHDIPALDNYDYSPQARALAEMAPNLSESLLREALMATREIGDTVNQIRALAAISAHLSDFSREEALQMILAAARDLENETVLGEILTELASRLPDKVLWKAMAAGQEILYEGRCTPVLVSLILRMAELGYHEEALTAAREIQGADARARALTGIAPHLPESDREQVLQEALAAAQEADGWQRASALTRLYPYLPERLVRDALVAVRKVHNRDDRALALARIATYLPESDREQVLQDALREALAVVDMGYPPSRAGMLGRIAPYLPMSLLQEALVAAREIPDERIRSQSLVGLAPHIPEAEQADILQEALAAAQGIRTESYRAEVLVMMASQLPEPLLREALVAVRTIQDAACQADALIGLAPHLPESLLREALAAARELPEQAYWQTMVQPCQSRALSEIAVHLPEEEQEHVLREALAAMREIRDEGARSSALAQLASHLPESLLQEAVAVAKELPEQVYGFFVWVPCQSHALGDLALRLAKLGYPRRAMAMACEIQDPKIRAETLVQVVPYLVELSDATLYPFWCEALRSLSARTRADLLFDLRALAPVIAALGGEEAIAEVSRAIQDVGRWWP